MGSLDKIAEEIRNCKKCDLWKTRKRTVPGEGDPKARVVFIGEAPGYNEDLQGKPFVGKSGQILDELLASINLKRSEVFITSILKCRPPNNRNPKSDEIKACTPYLDRQLLSIKPKSICTLGNYATRYILRRFGKKSKSIGKIHGKIFKVDTLKHHLKVIPMYHPAVATYNANMKDTLVNDFKVLKEEIV